MVHHQMRQSTTIWYNDKVMIILIVEFGNEYIKRKV